MASLPGALAVAASDSWLGLIAGVIAVGMIVGWDWLKWDLRGRP
ncbi:MAG TPA: hypothetical protein VLF21_03255 [Candidatus Saccharimonadales bacterium]|nr:hypothetical protein [Candidatus Saccharimonadales bacterium]